LFHCRSEAVKAVLHLEIAKNISYLGANNLRQKWMDMVDKSKQGRLKTISSKNAVGISNWNGDD